MELFLWIALWIIIGAAVSGFVVSFFDGDLDAENDLTIRIAATVLWPLALLIVAAIYISLKVEAWLRGKV